ncbi:unnamed protein product, partial [Brassica oleracea var. botrytis]
EKRELERESKEKSEEWKDVSEGRVSRSSNMQSLKYGQVIIATPSRYAVLSNSGENGEELEQGEIEQKEEDEKVEDEMDNISHEEEEQME